LWPLPTDGASIAFMANFAQATVARAAEIATTITIINNSNMMMKIIIHS